MDKSGELLLRRCPVERLVDELQEGKLLRLCDEENGFRKVLMEEVKPVNNNYCKKVLREIVDRLDRTAGQLPEDVYESWEWAYEVYFDMLNDVQDELAMDEADNDVIMYKFSEQYKVNIAETPRTIANGSTGNRTWEAAVYLGLYLIDQCASNVVAAPSRILELGSGTGLVSLLYQQLYPFDKLTMTDGDWDVVRKRIPGNLSLNDLKPGLEVKQLVWGPRDANSGDNQWDYDLILGSDLTYDDRILEPLCQALQWLLKTDGSNEALLGATVRNEATTALFEKYMREYKLQYELITETTDEDFERLEEITFTRPIAPIRIYRINNAKI